MAASTLSNSNVSFSSGPLVSQNRTISQVLELAPDLSSSPSSKSIVVQPSASPTRVTVHAEIAATSAVQMRSRTYIASQRRRRVKSIRVAIVALTEHDHQEDFASYAFPIFDDLRQAIAFLDDFESFEGNASAVLRYVRNTFSNGGWLDFKTAVNRVVVVDILDGLLNEGDVEAEVVRSAFALLVAAGLKPSLPFAIFEDNSDESNED